jgi:hypothetical protein
MSSDQETALRPRAGERLVARVPVRARVGARIRGKEVAATLEVEGEVVTVAAPDGRVLYRHGRFDTALGWLGGGGSRHRFRLSSTCDDQIVLSVASRHAKQVGEIERWLHLDN